MNVKGLRRTFEYTNNAAAVQCVTQVDKHSGNVYFHKLVHFISA